MMSELPLILGSRSPRRHELLGQLVSPGRIVVCPPLDAAEAGFEGLRTRPAVLARLVEIAAQKAEQVNAQTKTPFAAIVCADTAILVDDPAGERTIVLGQPPESGWRDVVGDWFRRYYSGRTHLAATAVVIRSPAGNHHFWVTTEVTFCEVSEALLDWYLQTGESCGKAGGYALQGAGSLFVESLRGSPSNVVGLPLKETWNALASLDLL